MKIAGSAVQGAKDGWEEVALMFAASVEEPARILMQIQSTDAALAMAREHTAAATAALRAASETLGSHDGETNALAASSPGPFTDKAERHARLTKLVGWGSVGLAVVLGAVVFPLALVALVVALGTWFWSSSMKAKREAEARTKAGRLYALQQQRPPLAAAAESAKAQFDAAQAREAELGRQRAALVPMQTVKAVGCAYLPFLPLNLAGYPVIIDGTGSTGATSLQLPDLAANAEVLAWVKSTVESAKRTPILLRPSGEEPSAVTDIHGEENDLGHAIDTFGNVLRSVPVLVADVPLVGADTPLLAELRETAQPKQWPGAVIRGRAESTKVALAKVRRYTENMRGSGKDVEKSFRALRDDLRGILVRYGALRSAAVEEAHQNLAEVLRQADYAHVTYYCPRCNRVPEYMFRKLGIDLDRAHEADPVELINALQENEEARLRIVSDEGLMGDLSNSWQGVRELDSAILGWLQQLDASRAKVGGVDLRDVQMQETRIRALQSQKKQLLLQFQAVLRKIVTGNPRPVLELSRQARLQLDPETAEWDCPVCELHVDDPEVARMGRLLKIKDELLMPMWNALWVEKDDFRKSELFRTNEQLQGLVEKEAAALRDVADEYRADMRPVRENLMLATTAAIGAREQLEAAVNSLSALGIISGERAQQTMGRLGTMTGGDLDDLKKRAEAKESLLNQEPVASISRRELAIDPVSMLLTPEQLFREQAERAERTTLATTPGDP